MKKEEILWEIKRLKEMLEMNPKEWMKFSKEKLGYKIIDESCVYAHRTGVAIATLDNILKRA